MSYTFGSANNMSDLRAALVAACSVEGWSWNAGTEVLSKGALYLRVQIVSGELTLLGRTSALAGDAPGVVKIGKTRNNSGYPNFDVTWPAAYEIFIHTDPDEVYMVVNYDIDRFQFCAFGKSSVQGLPGTGMWVGATLGPTPANNTNGPFGIAPDVGNAADQSSYTSLTPALAYNSATSNYAICSRNYWLHSDLDGQGWWLAQTLAGAPVGIRYLHPLLSLQPSAWNSEAALLPIRSYKVRPSNKVSLTADKVYARHIRIDHFQPGQIIELGPDRWKVYPWHQKNDEARNGGALISHTGTLGWAIRYEGP